MTECACVSPALKLILLLLIRECVAHITDPFPSILLFSRGPFLSKVRRLQIHFHRFCYFLGVGPYNGHDPLNVAVIPMATGFTAPD